MILSTSIIMRTIDQVFLSSGDAMRTIGDTMTWPTSIVKRTIGLRVGTQWRHPIPLLCKWGGVAYYANWRQSGADTTVNIKKLSIIIYSIKTSLWHCDINKQWFYERFFLDLFDLRAVSLPWYLKSLLSYYVLNFK